MTSTVLVVGGYGVVGTQVSELLAARHPDCRLLIGGRDAERAVAVANRIGAEGIRIDVEDDDPLSGLNAPPTIVVVAVNDHSDRLLLAAARRGVAVVDIARWEERITDAHTLLAGQTLQAPVVLSSGWLAGGPALAVAAFRDKSASAHQVDIDILFALSDKAGPDSIAGFVDIHRPFTVWHDGRPVVVRGMSDPHRASFGRGRTARCYRVSTPDQLTLVQTGHAKGVSVRIAFDSAAVTRVMAVMVRTGLWAKLPPAARRRLLHNPGEGAAHHVLITMRDANGTQRVLVSDPRGQTHATAAGAVVQVERLLAQDGVPHEISYPEQSTDPVGDVAALRSMGLDFRRSAKEL